MRTRVVLLLTSALALMGAMIATPPASASVGGAHALLTKQLVDAQRAAGISTGCVSTLSPGCAPIPLQYNNGPVEASGSKNFVILWEPTGSTVASNYNSAIQQFFGDIGGSSLYGVASQYYQTVGGAKQFIANSASLGGTWTDTSAYPSASLQDSDIQNEVTKAIRANAWPTGVGNEYFVFLAKGENECMSGSTCSFSTFCAYHSNFASGSSTVPYSVMPYAGTDLSGCGIQSKAGTPNGADTDAELSITSHELIETVTDPQANAWFDTTGAEIGDKCAYTYGPTQSNGADITINGHPYVLQEEFSNSALGCAI